MKVSKVILAGMVLGQALSLSAHAKADLDTLVKAKAWVAEQQAKVKTSPIIAPALPIKPIPVEPPAPQTSGAPKAAGEEPKEIESPKSTTDKDGDGIPDALETQSATVEVPAVEKSKVFTSPAFSFKPSVIDFGFMHTKQDCHVVENGIQHKPTYCTMEDTQAATALSGMVDAINAQLDTVKDKAATAQVSVAYLSFSNKGVQRKLCELSKLGVQIRVFLDAGSTGQADELLMNNPDCRDASGKLNVRLSYLGGSTDGGPGGIWRLHHNKFLMIDPGTGEKVHFNFSSGNLSTFGTSLHLDHWVTTVAPVNSNLIRAQKCVMKGLEEASRIHDNEIAGLDAATADKKVADAYITTREKCFDANQVMPRVSGGNTQAQIDEVLKKEEIAPLFSPNYDRYVEKSFISAVNKIPYGGYLYIAIQHFLHGGVKNALLAAADRGVDVRIIMDDDPLHMHLVDGKWTSESEVLGVDVMINDLVVQSGGKIQVRLAETNHDAGGNGSMMHNKLAILNGRMSFSGAGHYTTAAMQKNWENFYFVTNKTVLSNYAKYFTYLWQQSVDINYAKSFGKTPTTAPSELAPAFVQLAQ
jgi:hypothetical protein